MWRAALLLFNLIITCGSACSGAKHQEASSPADAPTSEKSESISADPLSGDAFFMLGAKNDLKKFAVEGARAEEVNGSLNINLNLEDGRAFQINGIRGLSEEGAKAENFQLVLLNFKSAPHTGNVSQSGNDLFGRIQSNLPGNSNVSVSVEESLSKSGSDTIYVQALFKNLYFSRSEIIPE